MAPIITADLQRCIETCLDCYWTCRQESMTHCLEAGGEHVEPGHFRLMVSCAEICRTAADIMLMGSPHHGAVCSACAEICDACAKSCEDLHDMEQCARVCRKCAGSCRQMAGAAAGARPATSGAFIQPDS
jgi:hypothetical protein